MRKLAFTLAAAVLLASPAVSQTARKAPAKRSARPAAKSPAKPARKLNPRQQFVVNVVRSAVALPQPDPQDRLRVLVSAANVVRPVDRKMVRGFAREGARLESDLISRGETPAASMLAAGHFDCATAGEFVAAIPPDAVVVAEQSLIALVNMCSKQSVEPARRKLEAALANRLLAPRALLATMESVGIKSQWSQRMFVEMFDSLPTDANKARAEAPNYAAMYARVAPQVDLAAARAAGVNLLEWLNKMDAGNERQLALNIVVDNMKEVLGAEEFETVQRRNPIVAQMVRSAGQPAEITHAPTENVSVLAAMAQRGRDRSEEFTEMPASLRARESASHGFAIGTGGGDRKLAERYFDIAFSAADEVWANRASQPQAPHVIEEVAQAAAHVDSVDALARAQRLSDPTAQAIGMLAVARVVMSQQEDPPAPAKTPRR